MNKTKKATIMLGLTLLGVLAFIKVPEYRIITVIGTIFANIAVVDS